MLQTIQLANRSFHVPMSEDDTRRRTAFFDTGAGSLTPEEQEILTGLGIDTKLVGILKPYLAAFFDSLVLCQSDTNVLLNKQCEVVHYVLWQTLLASRYESNERMKENHVTMKPETNISSAMNSSVLSDLRPIPDSADDIREIFTLLCTPLSVSASVPVESVRDVFTLILT